MVTNNELIFFINSIPFDKFIVCYNPHSTLRIMVCQSFSYKYFIFHKNIDFLFIYFHILAQFTSI
jgi:hypothetical protein